MTTHTVTVPDLGPVPVTVTERGEGRPFLLLHGGAGPQSVDGFADLLAASAGPGAGAGPPRLRRHAAPRAAGQHGGPGPGLRRLARRARTWTT